MPETILYGDREIPLLGCWDTVVVGGGSAGAAAGIASARSGCATLIVDKSINLGGTAVNALVTPMMRSYTGHHTIFFDVENRLKAGGGETRDEICGDMLWFAPENLGQVLEDLYLEAGGQVLYDAALSDCIADGGVIHYLIVTTVQGLCAVEGKCYVDSSGDAVLARLAGVPVTHGDENGNDQISSLRFEMGGIDAERYRNYVMSLHDTYSQFPTGYFYESAMVGGRGFVLEPLFQKGVEDGVLKPEDLRYYQTFSLPGKPGCMAFNCPHLVELTDNTKAMDRSRAITQGHVMIRRLVKFLQTYMPGFENAYLLREASMLGIRESYRLAGKYVLTEKDYTDQARFRDAVARGDWYIDVHSATKGLYHQKAYHPGDYYEIPYRSMVCDKIKNIVVAGRCISTTFLMQASVRIIPTCIDMGQAAGVACACSQKHGIALNEIDGAKLQNQLDYSGAAAAK